MTATDELAEAASKIVWSKTEEGKSWVLRADYGTLEQPKGCVIKVAKSYGEEGLRFARQALIEDAALALR